jgi:hypothetical protein
MAFLESAAQKTAPFGRNPAFAPVSGRTLPRHSPNPRRSPASSASIAIIRWTTGRHEIFANAPLPTRVSKWSVNCLASRKDRTSRPTSMLRCWAASVQSSNSLCCSHEVSAIRARRRENVHRLPVEQRPDLILRAADRGRRRDDLGAEAAIVALVAAQFVVPLDCRP